MHNFLADITHLKYLNEDETLLNAICKVGGKRFQDRINILRQDTRDDLNLYSIEKVFEKINITEVPSPGTVRRLSVIKDKEMKMRVVAIGDYLSQTVLLPLHNYLFRALKRIPQDCTFAQEKGVE
jgi:hypothetical protein